MAGGVCCQTYVHTVSQTAPSPGISLIHILPHEAEISSISSTDSSSGPSNYSHNVQAASGPLKDVHVPTRLMENFLEIASDNTKKDIETCGVLGAIFKDDTFYITSLIIPKQESTSNSRRRCLPYYMNNPSFQLDGFMHIRLRVVSCRQSIYTLNIRIRSWYQRLLELSWLLPIHQGLFLVLYSFSPRVLVKITVVLKHRDSHNLFIFNWNMLGHMEYFGYLKVERKSSRTAQREGFIFIKNQLVGAPSTEIAPMSHV